MPQVNRREKMEKVGEVKLYCLRGKEAHRNWE